jgi:pilus assembly protein CpaF
MLQAMTTGHDGSLTTVHASSTADALRRIETMVLMAGLDLPHATVRDHVSSAVDVIVQLVRSADGLRSVRAVEGQDRERGLLRDLDGDLLETLRVNRCGA